MVGIRSVDAGLLELGRSLRATRGQVLTTLEIPAALPVDPRRPARRCDARGRRGHRRRVGRCRPRARGPHQPRPRIAVRHPAHVRDAPDDRPCWGSRCTSPSSTSSVGSSAADEPPSRHPTQEVPVSSRSRPLVVSARHRSARRRLQRRQRPDLGPAIDRCPRRHRPLPVRRPRPGPSSSRSGSASSRASSSRRSTSPTRRATTPTAGLEVEFQNTIDPNLVTLVGQGAIDVGISDGTSVIPAVSQGIPIKYVATIYGKFPSIVFSKTSTGITTAADLKGKTLGIPGKYGSSWVMLQALLKSAGLTPADLTITEYPDFGQGAAVAADAVHVRDGLRQQRARPARADRRGGHGPRHRRHHATARTRPDLRCRDVAVEAGRDRRVRRRDPACDARDQRDARGRA